MQFVKSKNYHRWLLTLMIVAASGWLMAGANVAIADYSTTAHGDSISGVYRDSHSECPSGTTCDPGDCTHCHDTFDSDICGVNQAMLFTELDNPDFCMACHTDSDSAQDPDMSGVPSTIKTLFQTKVYKHNVTAYPTDPNYPHRFSPNEETRAYLSAHKHVECNDCHNPHTVEADLHSSNQILVSASGNEVSGTPINGAFGVEPDWNDTWEDDESWTAGGADAWPSTSSTGTKEYQICFKCHADYNTNYASWGGSGAQEWTNLAAEFNPRKQSYHPVAQALPAADPGYNGSADSYGSNRLPPAFTSLVIGDSGLKTGGALGHITDSNKSWTPNQWQNWGIRFGSTDERPDHSEISHDYVRNIGSNTSNDLTLVGYFLDTAWLPSDYTVYSIEYYAGGGATKSGNRITHSIKDFNRYLPSLVGYTVVIQNDPYNIFNTTVNKVATGVVVDQDQSSPSTWFEVSGWNSVLGSVPNDGNVGYYFSATGQTMMCSDCHSNNEISTTAAQGPHGSAVKWMLKGRNRAWPESSAASNGAGYVEGSYAPLYSVHYPLPENAPRWENDGTVDGLFCLNCHSTVSFSKGGNGLQALGDPSNVHLLHNNPCIACHIMVPHGGKLSRLLGDQNGDLSGQMPQRYAYNNNLENMGNVFFIKALNIDGTAAGPAAYPTGSHGPYGFCGDYTTYCHNLPRERFP